jgi:hypothetical protein
MDPYYDYECFTLADEISKEYGFSKEWLENFNESDLTKIDNALNAYNNMLRGIGQTPINSSVQSPEITVYKNGYYEIFGGFRVYFQAGITATKPGGVITAGNEQIDFGPASVGLDSIETTIIKTESWIDAASSSLNVGVPDTNLDTVEVDLSVDSSLQANQWQGTNTVGVEISVHPDNIIYVAIALALYFKPDIAPIITTTLRQRTIP